MFRVKDKLVDESLEKISPIEGESSQITVPRELLDGVRKGNRIRMASFLFRNMSGLLPERLNNSDNKLVNLTKLQQCCVKYIGYSDSFLPVESLQCGLQRLFLLTIMLPCLIGS